MDTSFAKTGIQWKIISTISGYDGVTYEYVSPSPDPSRKYHLSKVVAPDKEHRTYSVR